ncbi:MAG: hypothetical protein K0S33_1015 [Bacteroidetes bacterium]|jgi:hypothetical protein|nr:hypothetical protein [Bacteroidota bacterium]
MQACADKEPAVITPAIAGYNKEPLLETGGQLMTEFDCPDSKFYAPIQLKDWDKTPVVTGRFPTYAEIQNGSAILDYSDKQAAYVRPYDMALPKLAKYHNLSTKKDELVVVIQVVQSAKDTVVAYRYLSGGCGGGSFHKFHFLNDEEIKTVTAL